MKERRFPFAPKSTTSLTAGDFFGIPLPNDKWACGRILGVKPNSRSTFFGAVMDWSANKPPTCDEIAKASLANQVCQHHIKTITSYRLTIDGTCPIDQSQLPVRRITNANVRGGLVLDTPLDMSVKRMSSTSLGGIYAFAVSTYGGQTDPATIKTYLQSLR